MSRYIDADKLVQDLNEFYANIDSRWQRGRDAEYKPREIVKQPYEQMTIF